MRVFLLTAAVVLAFVPVGSGCDGGQVDVTDQPRTDGGIIPAGDGPPASTSGQLDGAPPLDGPDVPPDDGPGTPPDPRCRSKNAIIKIFFISLEEKS